jgi:hypothetical protein
VLGLPNEAFLKLPDQRRNALLNQINALETQYQEADIMGVYNHLREIRKQTASWLSPKYDNPVALGYDYEKTLFIIDELLERVKLMLP